VGQRLFSELIENLCSSQDMGYYRN